VLVSLLVKAAQCNELDVLVPLRYLSSKLVLVGDPLQLPATIKSQKALSLGFGQSLFERLYKHFSRLDHSGIVLSHPFPIHFMCSLL